MKHYVHAKKDKCKLVRVQVHIYGGVVLYSWKTIIRVVQIQAVLCFYSSTTCIYAHTPRYLHWSRNPQISVHTRSRLRGMARSTFNVEGVLFISWLGALNGNGTEAGLIEETRGERTETRQKEERRKSGEKEREERGEKCSRNIKCIVELIGPHVTHILPTSIKNYQPTNHNSREDLSPPLSL